MTFSGYSRFYSLLRSPFRQGFYKHQRYLFASENISSERRMGSTNRCRNYTQSTKDINTISSSAPVLNFPDVSLGEYLLGKIGEFHAREFIADVHTGQTLTFDQLNEAVIRVGSALTKLGYKKGDVISICSTNSPDFVILSLAVIAIGGVLSAFNPTETSDGIVRYLVGSGARAVATDLTSSINVKEASMRCPNIKDIIVFGESAGCRPFSSLLVDDGNEFAQNTDFRSDDIVFLPYSSGTTGFPKGVMHTHQSLIATLEQFRQVHPMAEGRVLAYLPLFHIYGMCYQLMYALRCGLGMTIMTKFEPNFLQLIEEHQITLLHLVPPVCVYMAKHPDAKKYDLSSVKTSLCGAAPLSKEMVEEFQQNTNITNIAQGYGSTEALLVNLDAVPARAGSVGRLVSNVSAKVVDLTSGELLGPGSEGELCYRGPQVMSGYLRNPEATAETLINGWIHTGDVGYYDDDGYFYISDRVKELIKYKAFQVAPAELEAMLLTHPAVQDAAVIGVPHDEAGEVPKAFVVFKKGQKDISEDNIQAYINERVAPFKKIRGGVTRVDEIPKSPSGKILRRLLKQQYI